jgi:hypothetical protein
MLEDEHECGGAIVDQLLSWDLHVLS